MHLVFTSLTIRHFRPTAAGFRSSFGTARVTYTDKPFLRAYGTNQYYEEAPTAPSFPTPTSASNARSSSPAPNSPKS